MSPEAKIEREVLINALLPRVRELSRYTALSVPIKVVGARNRQSFAKTVCARVSEQNKRWDVRYIMCHRYIIFVRIK
jgi:hypothetical protein